MKSKAITYLLLVGVTIISFGCQDLCKKSQKTGSLLPPEVAGIWQAEGRGWQFEISPKGQVVSAIVEPGNVKIKPNETVKFEMQGGSFSTYKAGGSQVDYEPTTRELLVYFEIEHLRIVYRGNVIEGNNNNIFIGKISEDGQRWETLREEYFDYGPRFPMADIEEIGEKVLFIKVKE